MKAIYHCAVCKAVEEAQYSLTIDRVPPAVLHMKHYDGRPHMPRKVPQPDTVYVLVWQTQQVYDRTVNYSHMERELQRVKELTVDKVMKYWDKMEAAAKLGGKDAVKPILEKTWQGW